MPAYYRRTILDFLADDEDRILGRLTDAHAGAGFHQQRHAQTAAWRVEIGLLKACVGRILADPDAATWQILLEYPIPRRGRRIDAVLVAGGVLIVLEFKCGAKDYARDAIVQVEDYALDLADFHAESSGRPIVPVLVATKAGDAPAPDGPAVGWVKPTWRANASDLDAKVRSCVERYGATDRGPIDPALWDRSAYAPTPTIIEAAQALYAGQNVREISRNQSGIENLTRTTDAVIAAIEEARVGHRKRICFITGVPGAGKTLAGLNIVHNGGLHQGDLGVFLSGNVPLVRILNEALARDAAHRLGQTLQQSRRQVATFIQNVHRFIDAYFADPGRVPVDRVVVFDEAQRAWDAAQSARKFNRPFSEPEILLEVMDRHPDWALVVALVGGGQEINRGEAGLSEWGRAIADRFRHWDVHVSPELKSGTHATGACLFPEVPDGVAITEDRSLHLSVNLRSYRAEVLSEFVDAVLRPDPDRARELAARLDAFPIAWTRDLARARSWLRERRRGSRRIGLVASSGARRLRAHGLDVTAELDVEAWFLNEATDVRSSHVLEVPATEFGIQGLELDWTGVCWGGDLTPESGGWACRSFRGTRWRQVRDAGTRQHVVNKYRVLLTRAREGMVIWVPPGDPDDPTRPPSIGDAVADHLKRCGIPTLDEGGDRAGLRGDGS
ncbi:DNA/RNA helicase domain-containing protein [Tundrisphaera sp. TA3]|uniref:DNA/RNA helicase domain-containing protein n=1 Tax=Tundrisphaera sp. TA3 TaxID=3435775 RepID=UPI003EBDFF26